MQAPLPSNEAARLAALHYYQVLDAPPDPHFDLLTRLAAKICDTPVALLTLLDEEHQWVKSTFGYEVETMPRAIAFCAHAILDPQQVLVVEDMQQDQRFSDNPLVIQDPHVRFYAGAPLQTPEGYALGTLCAVDLRPHQLDAKQIEALSLLSQLAVNHFEWYRQQQQQIDLYQAALEQVHDGVGLVDLQGTVFYQNSTFQQMLGYTLADLNTPDFLSQLFVDPAVLPMIMTTLRAKAVWHGEVVLQTQHQVALPVELDIKPLYSSQQALVGYLYTVKDIRDRRQTEEQLRESQRFVRHVADAMPGLVYVYDLTQQRSVYFNRDTSGLLGYRGLTSQQALSSSLAEFVHPDDYERLHHHLSIAIPAAADGETLPIEYRVLGKDETYRWVTSWDTVFTRNEQGIVTQILGCVQDITSRKEIEAALAKSEERYRQMVEAANEGIWILDQQRITIFVNAKMATFLGYTVTEMLGRSVADFIYEEDGTTAGTIFERVEHTGEHAEFEFRLRHKQGNERWGLIGTAPIFDTQSNYAGVLGMVSDITTRKAAEDEVQRLNTDLEQRVLERTVQLHDANTALARAVRLKDEFLASMSHELRTPLTGILGLTEALQEEVYGPLLPKQMQSLQMVEESGRHLLALINDILDLSKFEAGRMELQAEECQVNDICQASLKLVKQLAQMKRLRVDLSLTPPAMQMHADPRRLKQMLVNLLSNAVKFTPEGGQIGLKVVGDAIGEVVHFTVWDTGIGIPSESLPQLFQPFTQLDSRLARQYSGTGLGLSLVRHMAELHHGRVEVTSVVGEGSQFTIILPVESQSCPLQENQPSQSLNHSYSPVVTRAAVLPLILLSDDNAVNCSVLSDYLSIKGYRVITAQNGQETIVYAHEFRPDLILTDIQMPGLDGFETIQQLRTSPTFATVPIIAVTALAMPEDHARCLAAGASEYLSKPYNLAQLLQVIQRLLASDVANCV